MRTVPWGHHATSLLPAVLELGADEGSSPRAASQGVSQGVPSPGKDPWATSPEGQWGRGGLHFHRGLNGVKPP